MTQKNYRELVLQWKSHEVTNYLLNQLYDERNAIVADFGLGMITEESIHKKNFQAGKLELLNQLLDEDFFKELIEDMEGENV